VGYCLQRGACSAISRFGFTWFYPWTVTGLVGSDPGLASGTFLTAEYRAAAVAGAVAATFLPNDFASAREFLFFAIEGYRIHFGHSVVL
jgi:hypothetical protein